LYKELYNDKNDSMFIIVLEPTNQPATVL
jgi:hypothetical protein